MGTINCLAFGLSVIIVVRAVQLREKGVFFLFAVKLSHSHFLIDILFSFTLPKKIDRSQLQSNICAAHNTDTISARLDYVDVQFQQKIFDFLPYSAISRVQKTTELIVYGATSDNKLDSNEMHIMCDNVRSVFIHVMEMSKISVIGDIPLECFQLQEPMESPTAINLEKYGGNGFLFEQFPRTTAVAIKGRAPLLNFDSVWKLSALHTLNLNDQTQEVEPAPPADDKANPPALDARDPPAVDGKSPPAVVEAISPAVVKPTPPTAAKMRSTIVDTDFCAHLAAATSLRQIKVGDCGNQSFEKLLDMFREGSLTYVSFIHLGIQVYCMESTGGKELELVLLPDAKILEFDFRPLMNVTFKKIKVFGRIEVPNAASRYAPTWRETNVAYFKKFEKLSWYIFHFSEGVTDVDLSYLELIDGNKQIFDSFWFVHKSVFILERRETNQKPVTLECLRVTHAISDLQPAIDAQTILQAVEDPLHNVSSFKKLVFYGIENGVLVQQETTVFDFLKKAKHTLSRLMNMDDDDNGQSVSD